MSGKTYNVVVIEIIILPNTLPINGLKQYKEEPTRVTKKYFSN